MSNTASPRLDPGARPPHVGVVVFPGSNDDRDMAFAFDRLGARVSMLWHKDSSLPEGLDGVAIPGGFSYGDYLRAGAMARFSPIMKSVVAAAEDGMPVIGACNGFQILCESGLLPGGLVRNRDCVFICKDVIVRADEVGWMGAELESGTLLDIPIKHGEGAYVPDPDRPPRVAFRYVDENPNGTVDQIAGIVNERGNVLGLMPHPEHAVDPLLGSTDGAKLLRSFLYACSKQSGSA